MGTQSLNGISRYVEFKTFSWDARLASGDAERVSETIGGSFELKQAQDRNSQRDEEVSPRPFRAPTKSPSQGDTLNNVAKGELSPRPFQLLKMASQDKILSNTTIQTTTPDTTGAVLGWPGYHCLQDTLS